MRFDEDADATNGKFLHQPHTKGERPRDARTLRPKRPKRTPHATGDSRDILLAKSG
jgi:hypothetical protein